MATPEKQVRVFVSSTFRDMHSERDHLVTADFSELRERIEQLGLEFFDVDLRWGVPAKDLNGEMANSWEQWYQAKIAEIVRGVESDESRRFAGEIETLNGHLKPIKSEARICQLFKKRFRCFGERIRLGCCDGCLAHHYGPSGKPVSRDPFGRARTDRRGCRSEHARARVLPAQFSAWYRSAQQNERWRPWFTKGPRQELRAKRKWIAPRLQNGVRPSLSNQRDDVRKMIIDCSRARIKPSLCVRMPTLVECAEAESGICSGVYTNSEDQLEARYD